MCVYCALQQEDYELMMEDEINFVMIDKVEGTEQEQEEGMSETERRQLTLEEVSNYNMTLLIILLLSDKT